jgi:molybdopterin/thiamine biosynthesis adenylyltransferase
VLDGTDNFPAKYLINDACVFGEKPFSHAGILGFEGQTFTHIPGCACYRCIFPASPPKGAIPTCSQAGILGSVAGIIGTIQATEALKYIIGKGELITNRLLTINALTMNFRSATIRKSGACPLCGDNPAIVELREEELVACDLTKRGGR